MRHLSLGIIALVLVAAGSYTVVAANRSGKALCSATTVASKQAVCESATASLDAACESPTGKIAGHFDPAMSGVCRFACATKIDYVAQDVLAQPGAMPSKLTQCPVSGVVFVVDATRPRVEIAGEAYATCCDRCATKLKKDPRHYLRV